MKHHYFVIKVFIHTDEVMLCGRSLSLPDIISLMHRGEYRSAISLLEKGVNDKGKPIEEKVEYCRWLAECYKNLEDFKMSGDWYLEAVKNIIAQQIDMKLRAKQALPYCEKALEQYREGGDAIDVLEATKLKQKLFDLSK
jgi:tetratricopeptide (TPR) repeat protein